MIRREFDEKTGIVYVHSSGLWDFSEIETHYALIRAVVGKLRSARGGPSAFCPTSLRAVVTLPGLRIIPSSR